MRSRCDFSRTKAFPCVSTAKFRHEPRRAARAYALQLRSEFGAYTPEAYERLLLEAIAGDATLFIRRDEVETAWQIVDSIRKGWEIKITDEPRVLCRRTWGPIAADDLLAQSGHVWHEPQVIK